MSKNLTYQGRRVPTVTVLVLDDETKKARMLNPGPSQRIKNHSPDGFNFGYLGSGPSQLALALLLDAIGETPLEERPSSETAPVLAERWYQEFKNTFVSQWNEDTFRITRAEIANWLRTVVAQAETKRHVYNTQPVFPKDLTPPQSGGTLIQG